MPTPPSVAADALNLLIEEFLLALNPPLSSGNADDVRRWLHDIYDARFASNYKPSNYAKLKKQAKGLAERADLVRGSTALTLTSLQTAREEYGWQDVHLASGGCSVCK